MVPTPASPPAGFPAPPWRLHGRLCLSVWRVGRSVVGTAFVDYGPGGDLSYAELLRARPARAGPRPAVTVTDIWVDSPASRDGGRALWAIPKELAELSLRGGDGLDAQARASGRLLARARFRATHRLPGRVPLRGRTVQRRDTGEVVVARLRARARLRLARAQWEVPDDGPFSDLRGRRPLVSLVLEDLRLRFGD